MKGKKVSPEQVEQLIRKVRKFLYTDFFGQENKKMFICIAFFWSMKTDVSLPLYKINKYYHNNTDIYENYI